MCAFCGAQGVPDFGSVQARDRIVDLIAANGSSPTLIIGRSGSGKSVAAAQFAQSTGRPCLWIEARGVSVSAGEIADHVARGLGAYSPGLSGTDADTDLPDLLDAAARAIQSSGFENGICVVVDDMGPIGSPAALDGIRRLYRLLRSTSSKTIITMRSTRGWSPETLCECGLLADTDLAFTRPEAAAVLCAIGQRDVEQDTEALLNACEGHAALFVVLARQAQKYGLDSSVTRTASLEAWLERVLSDEVSESDQEALLAASLLLVGSQRDLLALGVPHAAAALDRLNRVVPMLTVRKGEDGLTAFRVHDLVVAFLMDELASGRLVVAPEATSRAVDVLSSRHDFPRAVEILVSLTGPRECTEWLKAYGRKLLRSGMYRQLSRLIGEVPTQEFAGDPMLLLLWAELAAESGRWDDALSKCRLSRQLSEHAGDGDSVAYSVRLSLACLRGARRLPEADALSMTVLHDPALQSHTSLRAEAHFTLGHGRLMRGELHEVNEHLDNAMALLRHTDDDRNLAGMIERTLALLPALSSGAYTETLKRLSPLIDAPEQLLSARVTVRGNAAVALLETGRVSRCESLLESVLRDALSNQLDTYAGAYMPVRGCSLVARGATAEGIEQIRAGIAKSFGVGEEYEADQSRVYISVVMRAGGDAEGALTEAERALERLPREDWFGFRRLAAIEVAASLLALGDVAAARSDVMGFVTAGFSGNEYHALRAHMVLAEADRRDGRVEDAIEWMASLARHILSENSNWQLAMYCRAFPGLLGVVGRAVGVAAIPVHMLNMITPECAEVALSMSRGILDDSEYLALGGRLLGAEGMIRFNSCGDTPVCRVRLFGGLDVSVGGRVIRERDWRKRKARVLFAMLVIRCGQDIPRDQILEHLWPEMDEERARNNLYVAWSTMKSVLGGDGSAGEKSPYVENSHGVCRANSDTVRSDIDDLEEALAATRQAESDHDLEAALQAYERVASIYRGDLLPGDVYDDWFAGIRAHYRAVYIDAMRRAATLLLSGGDPLNALDFARRAIQADSLREDLYQVQMRCEIEAGMRSSAIDTYFLCRQRLSEDLGLDPSAETRSLYEEILAMEHSPRRYRR